MVIGILVDDLRELRGISVNQGDAARCFNRPPRSSIRARAVVYLASRIASIHALQSVSVGAFSSYCRWFSLLYDIAKQCCNRGTIKKLSYLQCTAITTTTTTTGSTGKKARSLHSVRFAHCPRMKNSVLKQIDGVSKRREAKRECTHASASWPDERAFINALSLFMYVPYKSGNPPSHGFH